LEGISVHPMPNKFEGIFLEIVIYENFEILRMSIQCCSVCTHVHNRGGEAYLKFVLIKNVHFPSITNDVRVF